MIDPWPVLFIDNWTWAHLLRQTWTEADSYLEWWHFSTEEGPTFAKIVAHHRATGSPWPACQYCQIRHVCADGPYPCYQHACPDCFWLWECLNAECDHEENDPECPGVEARRAFLEETDG